MNGEVITVDDVPGEFSERVVEAFLHRPGDGFSLALSGGETARRCYETTGRRRRSDQIDWWQVDVYWGDERCVPPGHPDSNERLVREALLERVGAANAVYPMRCDEGADTVPAEGGPASAASTSSTLAWGPTATPRRCSPARRPSTPTPAAWSC